MHSIRGLRISVQGKTTPKGLPEQPQNPVQKTFVQPMTYGELLVDRLLADRDVAEHQHVVPRAASAGWSGHDRHDCRCCVALKPHAVDHWDDAQGSCWPEINILRCFSVKRLRV